MRKRYVGEKVRFQPRRNVKSREEYRKEVVEGNNNYQEIEQTKNIGTQYFHRPKETCPQSADGNDDYSYST